MVGDLVAPHVGAWIETVEDTKTVFAVVSLPMWERGLKQELLVSA